MIAKIETLAGPRLRHAVAAVLKKEFTVDKEPTYGVGHRILIKGDKEFFRPDVNWEQGGPLVDTHWRAITAWLIETLGPNWRDNIDGRRGDILVWFMRGLVGSVCGTHVGVPEWLEG